MNLKDRKICLTTSPRFNVPTLTVVVFLVGVLLIGGVFSSLNADDKSPKRADYFPNTEELQDDEMRVVALGTGTPIFADLRHQHRG